MSELDEYFQNAFTAAMEKERNTPTWCPVCGVTEPFATHTCDLSKANFKGMARSPMPKAEAHQSQSVWGLGNPEAATHDTGNTWGGMKIMTYPPKPEAVEHPSHYNQVPGIECIDVVRHFPFIPGNVIKYVWRSCEKGNQLEDLKKARKYLDFEIAELEAKA